MPRKVKRNVRHPEIHHKYYCDECCHYFTLSGKAFKFLEDCGDEIMCPICGRDSCYNHLSYKGRCKITNIKPKIKYKKY